MTSYCFKTKYSNIKISNTKKENNKTKKNNKRYNLMCRIYFNNSR